MTSRRRTTPVRRPRVAGLTAHVGRRVGAARAGAAVVAERVREDVLTGSVSTAECVDGGTRPVAVQTDSATAESGDVEVSEGGDTTDRRSTDAERRGFLRRRAVPLLAAALVVLLSAAAFFGIATYRLRSTPAVANTALVDVAATAEVAGQLTDALETLYSYDFARLDENERAAREVITPAFATEFSELFGQVRALAPQQQAVVTATVVHAAVQSIEGDRAVLVAFMDQHATRAAAREDQQQVVAAGRVTVTGERVDGRWKIAEVSAK